MGMKRLGWLAAITAAAMVLIWFLGRSLQEEPTPVRITAVTLRQVEQTVRCNGRVEQLPGEAPASTGEGTVQIRVAVPESRLRRVAVGQQVRVTGAAFSAEWYRGRVSALASTAYTAPSGNTVVDAFITLEETDGSLRAGLTARADICVATVQGILLPYSCLLADEEGREYVFLSEGGRAVARYVTVLEETAEGALVTDGLREGDRLIVDPGETLVNGARIREVAP